MEKTELALRLKIYEAHVDYARFCEATCKKCEKEVRSNLVSSKKAKHVKMKNMYHERAFKKIEEAISYNAKAEKEYEEALITASKYSLSISTEEINKEYKLVKQKAKKLIHQKGDMSLDRLLP